MVDVAKTYSPGLDVVIVVVSVSAEELKASPVFVALRNDTAKFR
jgi:hypothetical protein